MTLDASGKPSPAKDPWQHQPEKLRPAASVHAHVAQGMREMPAAGATRGLKSSLSLAAWGYVGSDHNGRSETFLSAMAT
eukprot:gene21797-28819_t